MTYSNGHKPYGYDKNVDYSEKMNAAAAAGDYAAAARYEQQRNEKIAGEGLTQYQPTQQYAQYLPKTNAEQTDELFEQIMNRDKFSYDLNGDALYQQYKDRYLEQGRLAMQDTMGQAAALTGGYGNSYAQTVGQQAYAQQLDRLNDLVPDLYTLALSNYEREGENLWQQYEAYAAREQQEYDRWLEEQNQIREEEKENKDDAFSLAMTMLQNGLMPSESVLSTAGLSTEDAKAIYDKANTPVYRGVGSVNDGPVVDEGTPNSITDMSQLGVAARNIILRHGKPYKNGDYKGTMKNGVLYPSDLVVDLVTAYREGNITAEEQEFIANAFGIDLNADYYFGSVFPNG